jgi:outer membrane protein
MILHRKFNTLAMGLGVIAALLILSIPAQAQAQPRLGTIDLKKVFDGYYKTKQADVQLKDRAADAEKVLKGMLDDYQKANEEYKKLIEGANDQAVSGEEREKRKKSAETKLYELQEIEKSVAQFRRETQTRLEEQKLRMRDNILREIREVITAKARTANYTMVFDTAAESANRTPILLFTNGQNDMTDEVLSQINATAPPGSLSSGPTNDKPLTAPPVAPATPTRGATRDRKN